MILYFCGTGIRPMILLCFNPKSIKWFMLKLFDFDTILNLCKMFAPFQLTPRLPNSPPNHPKVEAPDNVHSASHADGNFRQHSTLRQSSTGKKLRTKIVLYWKGREIH
jgi:hypothetical protein